MGKLPGTVSALIVVLASGTLACKASGSFNLGLKKPKVNTPSTQTASASGTSDDEEEESDDEGGGGSTASTGGGSGGGGGASSGGGGGIGKVVATGKTAEEKKAETNEYMLQGLKEVSENCKTKVDVQVDWPSFAAGYKWIDSDSDTPGNNERVVALRCFRVLEHMGSLCSNEKTAGPAGVATVKKVVCSYNSDRRAHIVTGDETSGVLTVKFNFSMDPDMSTVGLMSMITTSDGTPVGEVIDRPKIEKQLSRDVETLGERCGISGLTIKIDYASFRGHLSKGPEELLGYWEGMRGGVGAACSRKMNPSFFAKVKSIEIKYDGSLTDGDYRHGGAVKYELVGGVFRLRMNPNVQIANMEENVVKFIKEN